MSTNGKPGIVFAHGLWADGSCYSKVIPALQTEGYQVISTQNTLDSLAGDDAAAVTPAAGADDRVAGLVYIAALAPDDDETSQSQIDKFPPTEVFQHVEV